MPGDAFYYDLSSFLNARTPLLTFPILILYDNGVFYYINDYCSNHSFFWGGGGTTMVTIEHFCEGVLMKHIHRKTLLLTKSSHKEHGESNTLKTCFVFCHVFQPYLVL